MWFKYTITSFTYLSSINPVCFNFIHFNYLITACSKASHILSMFIFNIFNCFRNEHIYADSNPFINYIIIYKYLFKYGIIKKKLNNHIITE